MAARRDSLDDLEVALVGPGVALGTVSLAKLAELLRAAEDLIEAVAKELSVPIPTASLIRVRTGSAAYHLHSRDQQWRKTARRVETVIRTKAKKEPRPIRERLRALHAVGGKSVKVRVTPVDPQGKRRGIELVVEPPVETEFPVSFTATIYARVVGLFERADAGLVVWLDRDDGGRVGFSVDEERFAAASALMRKQVKVIAEGTWDVDAQEAQSWRLLSIEPWTEKDLISALSAVREELDARGGIDVEEMLRELGD